MSDNNGVRYSYQKKRRLSCHGESVNLFKSRKRARRKFCIKKKNTQD